MDCIDRFLQDIHAQQFYKGTLINPTRFFLLDAFLRDGELRKRYSRREVETLVYRYYADNTAIATRHPRVEIRNIAKHGITIIREEVKLALETWVEEAVENFISFDSSYIYLEIDSSVDYSADVDYLRMVVEELFSKTYGLEFPKLAEICGIDTDVVAFGQGAYRSHLMEEMQYCVCCDEYNIKKLHAVHILPDALSENKHSREATANGLIMCYEHAQEYLHQRFYFNSSGKIVNLSSSLIHRSMRLGQKILTAERQVYLSLYEQRQVKK